MDKLVISIVVSGENIFGNSICEVKGAYVSPKGKFRDVEIITSVTSAKDLLEAIEELFTEPEEE